MLSVMFASVLLRLCFGFVSKATVGITGTLGYRSEKLPFIYLRVVICTPSARHGGTHL